MKLLHSLALAALIALPAAFPAGAQDDTPPPPRPDRGAEATPAAKPDGVEAPLTKDLAGPYLAGRVAATDSDFAAAADYYLRALKQDPSSQFLSDGAQPILRRMMRFFLNFPGPQAWLLARLQGARDQRARVMRRKSLLREQKLVREMGYK